MSKRRRWVCRKCGRRFAIAKDYWQHANAVHAKKEASDD